MEQVNNSACDVWLIIVIIIGVAAIYANWQRVH